MDAHLSLHFKEYRNHIHQHWYHMMQDHGVEVAQQGPYDSITMDDWTVIYRHYEDPTYQVTHPNFFFQNLIIFKFNLLPTNLTANCTEKMCPECCESGGTDRIVLWRFEIVRSSHGADGK